MAEFNLLPWRERRRAQRRRNFLRAAAGTVLAAASLLGVGNHVLLRSMDAAQRDHEALRKQLAALEMPLARSKALAERSAELELRMAALQELDGRRVRDALLLDALARALPQGAYYTALAREGAVLRLEGVASGAELTELMRALSAVPQLAAPELREIAASRGDAAGRSAFVLSVPLRFAQKEEDAP